MGNQQQPNYGRDWNDEQQADNIPGQGNQPPSLDKMLEALEANPENEFIKGALYRAVWNLAERRDLAAVTDFGLIIHSLLGPKGNIAAGQPGSNAPVTHTIQCSKCGAAIQITA